MGGLVDVGEGGSRRVSAITWEGARREARHKDKTFEGKGMRLKRGSPRDDKNTHKLDGTVEFTSSSPF